MKNIVFDWGVSRGGDWGDRPP